MNRATNSCCDQTLRTDVAIAFILVALSIPACRSPSSLSSTNPGSDVTTTSTVPPFATKEPERYRALRTTTFTESTNNPAATVNETRSSNVLIARDGENRREELEIKGGRIVFIESITGRFVLLPSSKLYADISTAGETTTSAVVAEKLSGVSPDLLVNEAPAVATYQKMGTEVILDRTTTKYRVTGGMKNTQTSANDETMIWIDESLGMPIRSETVHGDSVRSTKATMELKDIQLDVDPILFTVPRDHKRVEAAVIFELVRKD